MNNKIFTSALILCAGTLASMASPDALRFNPDKFTRQTLTMPDGQKLSYKAYEGIYYVTNVEDSTYQTLNIYVPDELAEIPRVPILLRT